MGKFLLLLLKHGMVELVMADPSPMGSRVQFAFLVVFLFVSTAALFTSVVVAVFLSSWLP